MHTRSFGVSLELLLLVRNVLSYGYAVGSDPMTQIIHGYPSMWERVVGGVSRTRRSSGRDLPSFTATRNYLLSLFQDKMLLRFSPPLFRVIMVS